MAQGIFGEVSDRTISIPIEDYAEYQQLLKARQVIVDKLEVEESISVLDLLSALGGMRASTLYQKVVSEIRESLKEEVEVE